MNIFQYFRDLITALNNIGITLKAIAIDIAEIRKINSQILLKFGPRWPGLFSLRFISQLEGDGMASKFLVDAPLPELPEGNPDKVTFRNVKLTVNGVESVHKLLPDAKFTPEFTVTEGDIVTGSLSDEDQVGNLNLHPSTFTETITDKVGPRDPGAFSLRYKAQLDDVDPPPPGDDDSDNDGDDEGDNEEVENPTDED